MQKNYLIAAFEQTAAERFPAQGPELLAAELEQFLNGVS